MPTAAERRDALQECAARAAACTRCPALARSRVQVVFGAGPLDAGLLLVGEAPDREEDRLGALHVGRAGRFLDQLLAVIGLNRDDVYVCDLVRCHPPDNREPRPAEIANCREYLERTVELVAPRVVCPLGHAATKALRGEPRAFGEVRGRAEVRVIGGRAVRLMPLLHPAAALYRPETVEILRADVARLPALLALPRPEMPGGPTPDAAPVAPEVDVPRNATDGSPSEEDDPPAQLTLL